jgi:AcrR family transcriptional regulator
MTESTAHRAPGRPRRADVEDRVLGAAIALLSERGIEGLTTSAVVERSGVARATVYLRWPNRQALVAAAVRRAMGRPVIRPEGSVEDDLRRASEQVRAILASSAFRGVFPAVVAALTTPGSQGLTFDALAPGRAMVAREYDELAGAQGFRDDVSGEAVVDLLIGAGLAHFLVTGEAPSAAIRDESLAIVFDGIKRRADR